jgi:transcriptional regulator with XRE-family HTH domain
MKDLAANSKFIVAVVGSDGSIMLEQFMAALKVNKIELANAAGLSRSSISKTARLQTPATQARLRELAEIVNRILPWCGSIPQAFAWYRSQPIPAFGDLTAEDLVRMGRTEHLKSYLEGIALGGYA